MEKRVLAGAAVTSVTDPLQQTDSQTEKKTSEVTEHAHTSYLT